MWTTSGIMHSGVIQPRNQPPGTYGFFNLDYKLKCVCYAHVCVKMCCGLDCLCILKHFTIVNVQLLKQDVFKTRFSKWHIIALIEVRCAGVDTASTYIRCVCFSARVTTVLDEYGSPTYIR